MGVTVSCPVTPSLINHQSSENLRISRQSTTSGKNKWWFVLHGDENNLISLETT